MDLLLANGTTITLSAADTNPAAQHLWRAACVGVGRLGIITSVTFRIVPQRAIQRTRTEYTLQVWGWWCVLSVCWVCIRCVLCVC